MKEKFDTYKNQLLEQWNKLSKTQKWMSIGATIFIVLSLVFIMYWFSTDEFVPIYENLSPVEAGEIVNSIESMGIDVQVSEDGRTISVPESEASRLKVELAHEGIPRSGNINYSVFSENMGLGMTDRQFDVVERDAMQNELRYLIEQIEGIQQAQVMITLPSESIWLADEEEQATASVVVTTRAGMDLNQNQINGLYHIISRSVPNLPVENITIMNQNWHTFELRDESEFDTTLSVYQQHREIKRDVEQDIQRELQHFLGTILGMDKVIVSVFTHMDFSQEIREEEIVEPIDEDNNEGIAISIERIQESFVGEGEDMGGIAGTGETDIAGYPGTGGSQDSEYDRLEERINNEVNRIHRQVESSPYLLEDITIHVGVEPPDPDDPTSLTPQHIEDITSVLRMVVETSTGIEYEEDEIDQKISVFANEFMGRPEVVETETGFSMNWLYALGMVAAVVGVAGAYLWIRRNRQKDLEEEEMPEVTAKIDDLELDALSEQSSKEKQIEKLAKEKPDEVAKLLKGWLSDD